MKIEEYIKNQVDSCHKVYNSILETAMHKIQDANPMVQSHISFIVYRAQKLIRSIDEIHDAYLFVKRRQEDEKVVGENKGTK